MSSQPLPPSSEEEDALHRSTKKIKDGHTPPLPNTPFPVPSYKAKLVEQLPGAYETAFSLVDQMQEDAESDTEAENVDDGDVVLTLTKEDKIRIRSQWSKALIIKTFGRTVGYHFLSQRVRELWGPARRLDLVDLGHDYFLARFELGEDLDHVLKNGPWFIGQHFLAIKSWEPEFKASSANLSQVAIWIRLPELPIEYYDPIILKKIGSKIGPVLRIDGNTASNARGRFARLCVQVSLDKPLAKNVIIGKFRQPITYEGIHSLCFSCGRLGHRKDACPHTISVPTKPVSLECENHAAQVPNPNLTSSPSTSEPSSSLDIGDSQKAEVPDAFGPWFLVSRKKPHPKVKTDTSSRSPQSPTQAAFLPTRHSPIPHYVPIPNLVKGTETGTNKGKRKLASPTILTPKLNTKAKPKALSLTKQSKAHTTTRKESQPNSHSSCPAPWPGQASTSLNTISDPSLHTALSPFSFSAQSSAASPTTVSSHHALGNLAQEQDHRTGGQNDQYHSLGPADNSRLDGQRSDGSLELHISSNGQEQGGRLPTSDRPGLALHPPTHGGGSRWIVRRCCLRGR
ncbi:hypothetical protein CFP56_016727 [Quercus suber]|uniref:CCHC-type domain-containing protein n=1 Tax=Quercus suber TaxID=58331 RepID=A0AAW0KMP0_QUESU